MTENQNFDVADDAMVSRDDDARERFVHTVRAVSLCMQARVACYLIGDPGEAKTSFIEYLMGKLCVDHETSIAALQEPPEYGGYPIPVDEQHITQQDKSVRVVPAHVRQAPVGWVLRLAQVTDPTKLVGLFLDELPNGAPATRSAALRGILDGVWGETKIPRLTVVAAGNEEEHCESGYRFSAALANRFCHIPWHIPGDVWEEAYAHGFEASDEVWDPRYCPVVPTDWQRFEGAVRKVLVPFRRSRPNLFSHTVPSDQDKQGGPWPSKRTWTLLSRVLAAAFAVGENWNSTTVAILCKGLVGEGASKEFLRYARSLDLPDPEELLADPSSLKLPARGDKAWAVLYSVADATMGNLTKERWRAAWKVFGEAHNQQRTAIAAASVRRMVVAGRNKWGSKLELVPELDCFHDLLKGMGIGRQAQAR